MIGGGSYRSPYKNLGHHIFNTEDMNILGSYLKCLEIDGEAKKRIWIWTKS
jgi:hypothetical protein